MARVPDYIAAQKNLNTNTPLNFAGLTAPSGGGTGLSVSPQSNAAGIDAINQLLSPSLGPSEGPPTVDTVDTVDKLTAQERAEAAARQREIAQARVNIGIQNTNVDTANSAYEAALRAIGQEYNDVTGDYRSQTERARQSHDSQMSTNVGNYNRNRHEALLNAARGRQGLFGSLASLGALSGTGINLADRAVQQGANLDIAGANTEYGNNLENLTGAWKDYEAEDKARMEAAQRAQEQMNQRAAYDRDTALQAAYNQLAQLYQTVEDSSQSNRFLEKARGLAPQIGESAALPGGGPINRMSARYSPEALGNYVSGASDVSIQQGAPTGANLIPSLMASIRRREQNR